MAKVLKAVAMVAGAVLLVTTGVGAMAGAGLLGASTTAAAALGISAATLTTITSIATLVAVGASVGASIFGGGAQTPPASGTVNKLIVDKEAPSPYLMGRTYFGGILRHDQGYGASIDKVPNPYRGMVIEYGVGGPYESLEGLYSDFNALTFSGDAETTYYSGFMYRDYKLGLTSETALTPHFSGLPDWTTSHKLSGKAAILWNLLFDKAGKVFASGMPLLGAVWKGAKVYDPRLDSTYPGGSGTHRITDETTWEYSDNPGLHALAYAYGRYKNGVLVFGIGLPITGIKVSHFVTLANVCDTNVWKVGGVIFEPATGWTNLKDILIAGCAEPLFVGGQLGVKINAPHVSLDTLVPADLADDDAEIVVGKSWRDRQNTIAFKYREESSHWDYVTSPDIVSVPAYVTADGEVKRREVQYNLVQQASQAAQLAAYELVNQREIGPITLVCKPRMRTYGPGDMLTLSLPDHGLSGVDAVITNRVFDPANMTVTLTLDTETTAKHAFALGQTATAPPAPALTDTDGRDTHNQAVRRGINVVTYTESQAAPATLTTSGETAELVTIDVPVEAGDTVEIQGIVSVSGGVAGGQWTIKIDGTAVQVGGVNAISHSVSAFVSTSEVAASTRTFSIEALNTTSDSRTFADARISVTVTTPA
ncbi:MAG: hypothetical protein IPO08_19845 [Xanthomonadales bacterium]|nr:hypothetical protein [Xanthomonadales bacterium]